MQASEGTYKFYKDDRERIKSRSMLPTETLRYIEALEAVAKAAYEVWKNTPVPGVMTNKSDKLVRACFSELQDALNVVNFMDEDL